MKRMMLAMSLAIILGATTMSAAQGYTGTLLKYPKGPCRGLRDTPELLIRCAFKTVGIPGEIPTALYVAQRESGLNERAYNGICAGLFQMHLAYWQGRVTEFLYRSQFPNTWPAVPAFNGRANALVAAKMVKRGGWGPWSL
jgi:hypothetical protein